MAKSLREAVDENRRRWQYRRMLSRLRLRYFEYEDRGEAVLAKYLRVRGLVEKRLRRDMGRECA